MYKIAISGRANTGKNTLSKMIVKQLRQSQKKRLSIKYMAFADPIKKMIQVMFPDVPKKFLFGSSKYRNEVIPGAFKKDMPLTVRQLLLDLGTEIGRGYKNTIWLDNFDHRFAQIHSSIVVVTDVRFRNEFDHLKQKGFFQVRLYRDTDQPAVNHISESNQITIADAEFDYVIHNDKTLQDLKKEVSSNIIPRLVDG
jgi:hypothetical protein